MDAAPRRMNPERGVNVSAILETLSRLNVAVDKLEITAAEHEQKTARLRQQDLFAAPRKDGAGEGMGNGTVVPFDPSLFSRKLDLAIRNVETLLQEG
jgi:hypothetical protein